MLNRLRLDRRNFVPVRRTGLIGTLLVLEWKVGEEVMIGIGPTSLLGHKREKVTFLLHKILSCDMLHQFTLTFNITFES